MKTETVSRKTFPSLKEDSFLVRFWRLHPAWQAPLITGLAMTVLWLAPALIIPLAPFGNQTLCTNDGYAQYMPFLSEFWSVCHGQGSLLYSFHGGLGGNFYLTIAYYLFSPFSFLVLLFGKSQIPAAANLIIIVKNIAVAIVMAWYLQTLEKKSHPLMASACAVCFALSFYFLGYAVNFMWMDSIALLPVILYGLHRLDTRKGRACYLLSLAFAILFNFYIGAILCIFLVLYYVVILLRFNRRGWMNLGWFAACSIAAAMMAGIVLLPVVQGMLMDNASRMSPPDFEIYNGLEYVFSRFLPDADVVRITHNRGTINLYMGSISVFLLTVYLLTRQKNLRMKYGLLSICLLYLCATQISWLNYAFHGFYLQRQVPNRFDFLVAMLAAIMMFHALVRIQTVRLWKLCTAALVSSLFFAGTVFWTDPEALWLAFLIPAVIVAALMACAARKPLVLCGLIMAESMAGVWMCAPGDLESSYTNMAMYLRAADQSAGGRSEILCSDIVNAPTLYGLNGVSAFNSVINPQTAGLLGKLGFASGENYYRFYGYTPLTAMLFGVQTIIETPGTALPYPWQDQGEIEALELWTTALSVPIGITGLNGEASLSSANKFENINQLFPDSFSLLPAEISVDSGVQADEPHDGTVTISDVKENDEITLTLDPVQAQNVYLYGKMSGAKRFTVRKNGCTVTENKYEGNIVCLGNLTEQDEVTVTFKAENDDDDATARVFLASLDPSTTARWIGVFQNDGLRDQQVQGSTITGNFTSDQAQPMVFTVPYDAGWQAQVNGQTVPVSAWQDAFVQIDLQPGENEIKLHYVPAGLHAGMVCSLCGLAAGAFILSEPSRRKKKPSGR